MFIELTSVQGNTDKIVSIAHRIQDDRLYIWAENDEQPLAVTESYDELRAILRMARLFSA